ncbi:hypothetical protein NFA_47270 [Nocardia farcinica IFM 10152]|uniref:Uncharacterized protein n=1 Tax=Nocardia farcinica (strain IFM 10152) TaxID=247156 RepID=Q5YQG2_NOCFA|nr:hypothetical protein NFA_47270 [Nocardia farcinica IFM 10152]
MRTTRPGRGQGAGVAGQNGSHGPGVRGAVVAGSSPSKSAVTTSAASTIAASSSSANTTVAPPHSTRRRSSSLSRKNTDPSLPWATAASAHCGGGGVPVQKGSHGPLVGTTFAGPVSKSALLTQTSTPIATSTASRKKPTPTSSQLTVLFSFATSVTWP